MTIKNKIRTFLASSYVAGKIKNNETDSISKILLVLNKKKMFKTSALSLLFHRCPNLEIFFTNVGLFSCPDCTLDRLIKVTLYMFINDVISYPSEYWKYPYNNFLNYKLLEHAVNSSGYKM
mgnify:CR=1 FL=1